MLKCPICSNQNPAGAKFCNNCGSPLSAARGEAQRRVVTVLFADVRRSTELSAHIGAESWTDVMREGFRLMSAAVLRYDGHVARLQGDGVLAYFGAPQAHEDDPERAIRAGLDLCAAVAEHDARVQSLYGIPFEVRVGINTGEVVLDVLGDAAKAEYTAIGDTANIAARLQSAATPGTVWITASTARLVRHAFELAPRGPVMLKGVQSEIETYEVVGTRQKPAPARGLEGISSPLVGRDAEFELLRGHLNGLATGAGTVVSIVGEAGLGKSRLIAELRRRESSPRRLRWLECRGVSYGATMAYHPWRQLGHAFIGASAGDRTVSVREKLHALADRTRVPAEDLPLLETMLSVETDASRDALRSRGFDDLSQPMGDAVIRAIRHAIETADGQLPHVLVFDDLHWADAASIDLLANVAPLVAVEPLLIICGMRPDRSAPAWPLLGQLRSGLAGRAAELILEPLDGRHAEQLLRNLIPIRNMPGDVAATILERSNGNPFFLEEVLRSLIDTGHLVPDDGGWRATPDISDVEIPHTLAGVLAARIDRLPDDAKRVAQAASVFGQIFQHDALAQVCRRAPDPNRVDDVDPPLGTLCNEELVQDHKPEDREYTFKHVLTREAAYRLLLTRRRRELHRLAGETLEEMYADRIGETASLLAWHFKQAGDDARTAEYAMRAAGSLALDSATRERRQLFDDAYAALRRLPDPPSDRLIDAVLGWTIASYRMRSYEGVIERLHEVEPIARGGGDQERLAQLLSWIALMYHLIGFSTRAEPYLVEGARLAAELGEEKLMLLPLFFATDAMVDQDPRAAIEQLAKVTEQARRHRMPELEGHALGSTALAHARLDERDLALDYIGQALAAAPSGGHRVKEADVHLVVGLAYLELGDLDAALRHLKHGTLLAQAENALECACAGAYFVGLGELEREQVDAALRQFEQSLEAGQRAGWSGWSGFLNRVRSGVAAARLKAGEPAAADELETSLANARSGHDEYLIAVLSEQLAGVELQRGDSDRAAGLLDDALAYYTRTGMRRYEQRARALEARITEQRGSLPIPPIGP